MRDWRSDGKSMKSFSASRPVDIGELLDNLAETGVIGADDAKRLRFAAPVEDGHPLHPLDFLAAQGLVDLRHPERTLDAEALLQWLSTQSGLEVFHIDPLKLDAQSITAVMSFAFAKRHRILAVEVGADEVVIAVSEPFVTGWVVDLQQVIRKSIRRVLVAPREIDRLTGELYTLARSVSGASGARVSEGSAGLASVEQLLDLGRLKDPDANDQHIVSIVDWLLQYAFEQRASDIHLEPRREQANVRFRIDGVLHQVYHLPAAVAMAVTSRLKILGRMNLAEKRRPQDGRLKTRNPAGNEIELRLSTLPTAFGEKMVMRVFDPDVLVRSFRELGVSDEEYAKWQGMVSQPHGIVLVTGPTGSGKTTTLYSTLKQLATAEVNVSTIEDPIEMVEPSFNQVQVQHGIGLDFASGVRALLRQDPDIIMIGEIRDRETAEMAVQAALTGHLVLSTLHTNDSPSAITRLLELGIPSYLIRATVLGVLAQRLVRVLCPHCKQPGEIEDKVWNDLVVPWKAKAPEQVYRPVGCLECRNTGFSGRQGVYEILVLDNALKHGIADNSDVADLRKLGIRGGMKTLRLGGARKIAAGLTTVEEVLRVTPSHDQESGE